MRNYIELSSYNLNSCRFRSTAEIKYTPPSYFAGRPFYRENLERAHHVCLHLFRLLNSGNLGHHWFLVPALVASWGECRYFLHRAFSSRSLQFCRAKDEHLRACVDLSVKNLLHISAKFAAIFSSL